MKKGFDFFDSWIKSQNEFLTHWTESVKKLQEAFLNVDGSQKGPEKEMISSAAGWGPPQTYTAHSEIFRQETPATAVFFMEIGLVKLSRIDYSGREIIAGLRRRHWMLGVASVLLGKHYPFTGTTLIACTIRSIAAERFLNLVETNTHFTRHVLTMLSQEILSQGENFVNLGCLPAIDRLKRLLYDIIIEVEGRADLKRQVKIIMPLKHKEIAQMIAVTPEHLSRLFKNLEHDGLIQRDGNRLEVRNVLSLMSKCEI